MGSGKGRRSAGRLLLRLIHVGGKKILTFDGFLTTFSLFNRRRSASRDASSGSRVRLKT